MHKNCLYKIIKFNKSCQKVYRLWLHTLFQLEVILMSPSLLLRKSPIDFKSWQRTEWMHQHRISTAVSERGCSRCESSTQVVHISFIVMKCLYFKKSTEFYCCISCVLSVFTYSCCIKSVKYMAGICAGFRIIQSLQIQIHGEYLVYIITGFLGCFSLLWLKICIIIIESLVLRYV